MSNKFPNIDGIPFFNDWKYYRGKPQVKISGIPSKPKSFKNYVLEHVKDVNGVQLIHSFICAGTRVFITYDPLSSAMGDNIPFLFVGFNYDTNIDGFFELSYSGARQLESYLKRIQRVNDTFQQVVNFLTFVSGTSSLYSVARNRRGFDNKDLHVATVGDKEWYYNGNTFYTLHESGTETLSTDVIYVATTMCLNAFKNPKSKTYLAPIDTVRKWLENLQRN